MTLFQLGLIYQFLLPQWLFTLSYAGVMCDKHRKGSEPLLQVPDSPARPRQFTWCHRCGQPQGVHGSESLHAI